MEQREDSTMDIQEIPITFSSLRHAECQPRSRGCFRTSLIKTGLKRVPRKRPLPSEFEPRGIIGSKETHSSPVAKSSDASESFVPPEDQKKNPRTPTKATMLLSSRLQTRRERLLSPDPLQGHVTTPIQVDHRKENQVRAEGLVPSLATPIDPTAASAGRHTLHLEAQHRSDRSLNRFRHGNICVVCSQKKYKYVKRFRCCGLRYCTACVRHKDENSLLEQDKFCPLCVKRGWNCFRPYFGSGSPVWKLLPADYKENYMESGRKVMEARFRAQPKLREMRERPDNGSLSCDRLLLYALRDITITKYGRKHLENFVDAEIPLGSTGFQDIDDGDMLPEPDLRWFVTNRVLPLERYQSMMADHEAYLKLLETACTPDSSARCVLMTVEKTTDKEQSLDRETVINFSGEEINNSMFNYIPSEESAMELIENMMAGDGDFKDQRTQTDQSRSHATPEHQYCNTLALATQESVQVIQLRMLLKEAECKGADLQQNLETRDAELAAKDEICLEQHVVALEVAGKRRGDGEAEILRLKTSLSMQTNEFRVKQAEKDALEADLASQRETCIHDHKSNEQFEQLKKWMNGKIAVLERMVTTRTTERDEEQKNNRETNNRLIALQADFNSNHLTEKKQMQRQNEWHEEFQPRLMVLEEALATAETERKGRELDYHKVLAELDAHQKSCKAGHITNEKAQQQVLDAELSVREKLGKTTAELAAYQKLCTDSHITTEKAQQRVVDAEFSIREILDKTTAELAVYHESCKEDHITNEKAQQRVVNAELSICKRLDETTAELAAYQQSCTAGHITHEEAQQLVVDAELSIQDKLDRTTAELAAYQTSCTDNHITKVPAPQLVDEAKLLVRKSPDATASKLLARQKFCEEHHVTKEKAQQRIDEAQSAFQGKLTIMTTELAVQRGICSKEHLPDIADLGMDLCQARAIARGNVRGVETRLQGDNLGNRTVQRLLDNPIFDRAWVQERKGRKQMESGEGWVQEETAVKIEDDM